MPKIENIKKVQKKLEHLAAQRFPGIHLGKEPSVIVGYTANYGLYVHENLEARHAPGKQAKYLESPARTLNNTGQLSDIIRRALTIPGGNITKALLRAGLAIQRASQKIVPVDTGNLKNSAFTRLEQ